MSGNRYIRRGVKSSKEPKIGRMFLVSLGLHLLIFVVFSGLLVFNGDRDRRPVYYVDLTKMPVAKPQAGRPDARPKTTKKTTKKAIKKTVKKTTKKPSIKKTTKTSKPVVVDSAADIAKKLKVMQEKQQRRDEMEALKQQLAALAAGDSRDEDVLDSDAPLGMPDGQGDEEGVSQLVWLEAFIKANWSLSQYQVSRTDVKAEAWVIYNREGRLVDFSLQESSGERVFDDSIKRAILKSNQLEFEPGFANQKVTIKFNLKDLLDR